MKIQCAISLKKKSPSRAYFKAPEFVPSQDETRVSIYTRGENKTLHISREEEKKLARVTLGAASSNGSSRSGVLQVRCA